MELSQKDVNEGLRDAIHQSDLNKVRYYLVSPELNIHADIHDDFEYAIRHACTNGNLEIVQFLLESPQLKEKSALYSLTHSSKELINISFIWACESGNISLVKYLAEKPEFVYFKEQLCDALKFVCRMGSENRQKMAWQYESQDRGEAVIRFLLSHKQFPVLSQNESTVLSQIATINSVPLIEFIIGHNRFKPIINVENVTFACFNAISTQAYDVAEYLGCKSSVLADFTNDVHNVYYRMCKIADFEMIKYFFTSPVFKNQIDISIDPEMIWAEITNNRLKRKNLKTEYKIFEYLAISKELENNINFTTNNYAGFKKLNDINDIRALKILYKRKSLWLNDKFYDWMMAKCSSNFIKVFKTDFIKNYHKKLQKLLLEKNNTDKSNKI